MDFTLWDIVRNLILSARWTIALSLAAFAGGAIVGLAVLLARVGARSWLRRASGAYIALFQGTPLLMQLFLVFFGLPLLGFRIAPWSTAVLALTLSASAYLADIWRGGVEAIPWGQWDAAASLGLRPWPRMRLIVLPEALRLTRAPTVGFLVQLVKSTALASILGYEELLRTANAIDNATFQPFTVYGIVAAIYFALCFPLTRYARWLDRRDASPGLRAKA